MRNRTQQEWKRGDRVAWSLNPDGDLTKEAGADDLATGTVIRANQKTLTVKPDAEHFPGLPRVGIEYRIAQEVV